MTGVPGLELVRDVTPGGWIVSQTSGPWAQVGSLLPAGFEAYARIFHPTYRSVPGSEAAKESEPVIEVAGTYHAEVSWADVAAANRRVVRPDSDWIDITRSEIYLHGASQPGLWDSEPDHGSLPPAPARRLITVLAAHTTTPKRCWFALWEGCGHITASEDVPTLEMPKRTMWLFSGALDAWVTEQETDPWEQSASLWWPDDRAWCVATDLDLMSTYLAGSKRWGSADRECSAGRVELEYAGVGSRDVLQTLGTCRTATARKWRCSGALGD